MHLRFLEIDRILELLISRSGDLPLLRLKGHVYAVTYIIEHGNGKVVGDGIGNAG